MIEMTRPQDARLGIDDPHRGRGALGQRAVAGGSGRLCRALLA